jgi:Bestrophin, RFP-TM, chloride channel
MEFKPDTYTVYGVRYSNSMATARMRRRRRQIKFSSSSTLWVWWCGSCWGGCSRFRAASYITTIPIPQHCKHQQLPRYIGSSISSCSTEGCFVRCFGGKDSRTVRTLVRRNVLTTPYEAVIERAVAKSSASSLEDVLLDNLIDESVRTSARKPLIRQFDPSSPWIWSQFYGTIWSATGRACVARMFYAALVYTLLYILGNNGGYASGGYSTGQWRCSLLLDTSLQGLAILYEQLLSVTTITLTFFVQQSYTTWRKCCDWSRALQGRLHDLNMMFAAHAQRMPMDDDDQVEDHHQTTFPTTTVYTPRARQLLELTSRYVRLFTLLTYASLTRSHRPLLTPRGMRRLVDRGLLTPLERHVLVHNATAIPATQRHTAVLLWILRTFIEGQAVGLYVTGRSSSTAFGTGHSASLERSVIQKVLECRSACGAMGGELQGRMPLAYAHIVQVMVDLVWILYPFMAYSSQMSGVVCVLATGLLTIGYQGLVSCVEILYKYHTCLFQVAHLFIPCFE